MEAVYSFVVSNEDLTIRFSCPNHGRRIAQIVNNLRIDTSSDDSGKICRYTAVEGHPSFHFDGMNIEGEDIRHEAVFFENTEYPLIVRGAKGRDIESISLVINDHLKTDGENGSNIISDNGELYGALNFHNQVGMTDLSFRYKLKGESHYKILKFITEVLSYKLDYRSDLRTIIADIENEYAMLCSSFLKDTYLSMRCGQRASSELIWWQIFKTCYRDIIEAANRIIDRPKRRLRIVAHHERAERLATLPRDMENEYQLHRDNPAHLYRTEELVLSHDTIENRFLKHAINEMLHRFTTIKEHIMTAMHLSNPQAVDTLLPEIESNLLRLHNHSFFRGVGVFKGFTQDNLVMKQALGYKTILEKWIELQQGYELEEGMRKLEVKDISELYEIWCFIKVKNIVQDTLRELGKEAKIDVDGKVITKDFIPQLVYGGEVSFIDSGGVELATVSYNAQVEKAGTEKLSAIHGTDTMTTNQRPDIVLRLSKTQDGGMKYTYLFDAKYRIDDTKDKHGYDLPPEDAINQMHRYRDAIYYTEEGNDRTNLKKEIIAGYVLFPGHIPMEALDLENGNYYYQESNRKIGIGAFPLRPGQEGHGEDGSIYVSADSSENALRLQIRKWLEEESGREQLLEQSIPQKGLEYADEPVTKGTYFLSTIDTHVNEDAKAIIEGRAADFYSGYTAVLSGTDFQKIKYFAPVNEHKVRGYYKVSHIDAKDMAETMQKAIEAGKADKGYKGYDKTIRIHFRLGEYVPLVSPFTYGIDANAARGTALTRKEFKKLIQRQNISH